MTKVLFLSLLIWIWFFIAPVKPVYTFNNYALLYIIYTYIFLFLGFFLSFTIKIKKLNAIQLFSNNALNIAAFIGIISLVFRLIDRIYIRGVSFSENFDNTLNMLTSVPPSVFGLIGGIGLFFCYVPLLYSILQRNNKINFFYIILYLIPIFDAIIIGQRFQILTGFFLFVFTYISTKRLSIAKIFIVSLLLLIVLVVGVLLIVHRYENHNMELYYSLLNSGYASTLVPKDWILTAESANSIKYYIYFILSNLSQYFFHGIYEFSFLIDSHVDAGKTFGQFSFPAPYKLISSLLNLQLDPWDGLPHFGIYLSFFGVMYVDFGIFGLLLSGVLGFIFGYAYRKYKKGYLQFYLLYLYMSYVIIMMPVTSMLSYGLGNYILTIALILIGTKIKFKTTTIRKII